MRTPDRSREVIDEVAASGADLGVVVAFGQFLPPALLDAVPHGFVNVHFSLLPRWRGAAPVERAMLAGDARDRRLHHGAGSRPRHRAGVLAASARRSARRDRGRAAGAAGRLGTELLVDTLPRIPTDHARPQVGRAHLRRQAHRRGVRARLGRSPPTISRASCAPATRVPARGPPTTARGSRCGGRARCRRASTPSPAPCSGTRASPPATARWSWSRCSPKAVAAMDANAWLAGRRCADPLLGT